MIAPKSGGISGPFGWLKTKLKLALGIIIQILAVKIGVMFPFSGFPKGGVPPNHPKPDLFNWKLWWLGDPPLSPGVQADWNVQHIGQQDHYMAAFAMVVHNFSLEAKHGICLMFGLFSEVNLANHSGIQTFDPIPTAYNACPPLVLIERWA